MDVVYQVSSMASEHSKFEQKYQSIVAHSLYASLQTIPGKVVVDANPAALEMFGYTLAELCQKNRYDLLDRSDPRLATFLETRDREQKAWAELTGIRKNGERFPCQVSSTIYTDLAGEKVNSLVIIDLTESKRAEEQIRFSEAQFRGAFEYSAIGMALFDLNGLCMRANQSLCDMLGYTKEEFTRLRFDDITHPNDLPLNIMLMKKLLHGKSDSYHLEKRYLHKNGKSVWVLLGVSILRDQHRKPIHFISQIQDITKAKETEQALSVSEEKYRKIFENIQDIYYRTDKEGFVTEISPSVERYYGYKREQLIGRPVTDFYYFKEDRENIIAVLKEEHAVTDFELKLKSNKGELLYASVNARLIIENTEVLGSEGSIRDITQRKIQENELTSLNTELKAMNLHREKLLSVIGHDLRNPVAASLKLCELSLMDAEKITKEELLEYLAQMKRGLNNANHLLEDLLRWAQNQLNSNSFNPVWIDDVQYQVSVSIEHLAAMANAKNIKLYENIVTGIRIYADKDMLNTIIRNLVSNAIKFTSAGTVTVSAHTRANDTLFSVTDTGYGIPAQSLKHLFGKTFNYSTSGTSGEKGTGLGLELCRDFVEKHQGRIWVESTVGKGSIFYFTIPFKD